MAEKKSLVQKFQALLDERGWRSESELTRLHKFVHFWVLVGKSFVRNRCPIRASALSYTTLLALIPMFAVAISVTSSLLKKEGEEQIFRYIDKFISSVVPPSGTNAPSGSPPSEGMMNGEGTADEPKPVAKTEIEKSSAALAPGETNAPPVSSNDPRIASAQKQAARYIHEFIQNTRSGTLGVTGMVLLVFVAIRMLSQIESTFNDIWGVTRGRTWLLRTVLYWTTITLGPLLLIAALGLASGPHLQTTRALITEIPLVGGLIFPVLTLLILWLTFAMLYQLVPNTKVKFSAALIGGIVAGSVWHLNNVFGFLYVSRVVTNSKIYGSLGLVPVFMAGLYLSWFILLLGAQIAYAFQNRTLYLQEKIAENVNQRGREFVALRLMTSIGQRFQHGQSPPTIQDMSAELGIPSRLAQQVLQTLIKTHLVIEISGAEPAYTPARPLENINAHHVLQAMRVTTGQELVTRDEPVRAEVYGEFARIQEAEKQAASSISMLALVNRAQAKLELAPPPTEETEIKLSPALTPSVEPAAEPPQKTVESLHSSDFVPEKFGQGNVRQGNETQIPVSEKTEISHSTVVTPGDEERDFPL
jgi:membrane protein